MHISILTISQIVPFLEPGIIRLVPAEKRGSFSTLQACGSYSHSDVFCSASNSFHDPVICKNAVSVVFTREREEVYRL